MLRFIQAAKNWVEKPDYADFTDQQTAFYLQVVGVVIILVASLIGGIYALTGHVEYLVLTATEVLVQVVILWMVRRGFLKLATYIFLGFQLFFLLHGLLTAGSIHASSAVLYPMILIFASLLVSRRSFFIFVLLCIASVGGVIWAENRHFIPPYVPDPPHLPLFFTYSLILVGAALLIRFVTENMQTNLLRTRQHEQELLVHKEILDRVGQAVVAGLRDGTIVYWNKAASDYYGWLAEEALGRKFDEIVLVDYSPGVLEEIQATLNAGEVWSGELNIQKRDGAFLPTLSSLSPLHDRDGKRSGWVGIAADISERKQIEALRIKAEASERTGHMRQRLLEFSQELLSTIDMVEIFGIMRKTANDLVPHERFHPYWADEQAGGFVPAGQPYQKKGGEFFDPQWYIPFGQGLMSVVASEDRAEMVNDAHLDPRSVYPPGSREKIEHEHAIFLPIHGQGKVIGVLALLRHRTPQPFTRDEFELAQLLMSLGELALSHAHLFADLEKRVLERTEQLAASEERYRLISTVASDYMFATRLNEQGEMKLDWVAGAFERMTGYTLDEYVARGGWRSTLHPDDLELDDRVMAALGQNRPVMNEMRTLKKSGELCWIRVYGHPLWDAGKNRLVGIYGGVQDITERKLNEAREEHRRVMLEKIILLGKTLTQITDLQQCYREIHRAVQHGLDFDRVGLFLYDHVTQEVHGVLGTDRFGQMIDTSYYVDPVNADSTWRQVLENSLGMRHLMDYEAQANILQPDDSMAGVKEHLTVVAWVGATPIAFLTVDNLVTQRQMTAEQIEALQLFAGYVGLAIQNARWSEHLSRRVDERTAELEAANRELESLSYTIGHDLRSPIRAIVAYSQMLLDEMTGQIEPWHEKRLTEVNHIAQRMGCMVDDFLTFLRLGRASLKQKRVNPHLLVESVIDGFKKELAARQVEFSVLPLPECRADATLLKDVFHHLISNALKFSAARNPARIEVGAGAVQGQKYYYVRDNGVGFDMQYAGKLFGVFQRLHHESEFEGIGIGLATVKRIVNRHGGQVWAEAELDQGATFYFTLE